MLSSYWKIKTEHCSLHEDKVDILEVKYTITKVKNSVGGINSSIRMNQSG